MTAVAPSIRRSTDDRDDDDARALPDVDRRLALFRETGDPAALWPGLTEPARVAAARELGRVTAAVLEARQPVDIDPTNAHAAYALAIAGHTSGMGPVIGRWIETGVVRARDDAAAAFARHVLHARRRSARIEQRVSAPIDALVARGIVPVVLKGMHTSRAYFEEPGVRRMSDVDLLIPPDRTADAEAALASIGFRPEGAPLRPYKRDWLGPGVNPHLASIELAHEQSRWFVELHASLDRVFHPGAVARLDLLRSQVERFELAGRSLAALAPAPLLIALACHCSQELDGVRLLRLYEIVRVAREARRTQRLDWDELAGMLRRTGAARYTFPAFSLVNALAPNTIDERVISLGRDASTWASRHTVERLVPAGGSLDERGVIRQVMWTRGPVAIGQRLLRNLWPASFARPADVAPGWRVRMARFRRGVMSLRAPDERC
ncbi:MAG TPA: nucleotidyltransferase family protein [Gemmatimonadaceae bacterium]|nr:nucleotidyltransferase family protein [Gemmatimonadaceae bacterium]